MAWTRGWWIRMGRVRVRGWRGCERRRCAVLFGFRVVWGTTGRGGGAAGLVSGLGKRSRGRTLGVVSVGRRQRGLYDLDGTFSGGVRNALLPAGIFVLTYSLRKSFEKCISTIRGSCCDVKRMRFLGIKV
ncbi:hypothetical protein BJ875DRAFT_436408 [Amylocarpus encephaloides]|uniref:Uncharacterized protein n=1 Tax=Amylocarpus encephaloides TaxID=45428 RepID=A0A9P8CAL7_9HELO|nr:hypothetical protein BJ875DRAFT_436408 [Amylocarpus encephaloides]